MSPGQGLELGSAIFMHVIVLQVSCLLQAQLPCPRKDLVSFLEVRFFLGWSSLGAHSSCSKEFTHRAHCRRRVLGATGQPVPPLNSSSRRTSQEVHCHLSCLHMSLSSHYHPLNGLLSQLSLSGAGSFTSIISETSPAAGTQGGLQNGW